MTKHYMAERILLCASLLFILLSKTEAQTPLALSGCELQGASVVDIATGKEIANHNGKRRLTPASTTKLFSTAAALIALGPEARLRTNITLDKKTATVTIHGEFDPTTDSRHFRRDQLAKTADTLAATLNKLGFKKIRLVADDSKELPAPYCPSRLWEDMGNYYGAAPSCLMADDNLVEVYFHSPAEVGKECAVDSIVPHIPGFEGPKTFVTTYNGNSDKCNIFMAHDLGETRREGFAWYAMGQIPRGRGTFCVKSAMPYPTWHFVEKMANLLSDRGIETESISVSARPRQTGEVVIGSIWSPTIQEIAKETNHKSINLFADALMICSVGGGATCWEDVVEGLKTLWQKRLGVELCLRDGCGLSPMTAISPNEMTDLLVDMAQSDKATAYKSTLPRAGMGGTLANFGAKSDISGKVSAKSGSMSGVLTYAGYMTCASGREVAFCIMVNHHTESNAVVRSKIVTWLVKIHNNN